jgi:hypothetical protein
MEPRATAAAFFVLLLFAADSHADVGLPMLAIYLPPAWLLLLPIVGIETLVGMRRFGLPGPRALAAEAAANVFSTILGVPIVWSLAAGLELRLFSGTWRARGANCLVQATAQALWILPPVRKCSWVFPIAACIAGLTFFLLSVLAEYLVLRLFFPSTPLAVVRQWALLSNAASYAFLAAFIVLLGVFPTTFSWAIAPLQAAAEPFMGLAFFVAKALGAQ